MGPKLSVEEDKIEINHEMEDSGKGCHLIHLQMAFMHSPRLTVEDLFACSLCSWDWFRTTCSLEIWEFLCQRDYPKASPYNKKTYQSKRLNFTGVACIDEFLLVTRLTYPNHKYFFLFLFCSHFSYFHTIFDSLNCQLLLVLS